MAFVKLISEGILKHVISQNVDGLHRKSGIASEDISELHGNIYIEKCKNCKKEYLRDVDVCTSNCATVHLTGNLCDNSDCRGELFDNIINFGENLDQNVIQKAFNEGEIADLCLAMGSSLRVNPAAQIPKKVGKNGKKLVIVNLQKTPLDDYAKFVIHAFCDVVIEKLMEKLNLEIPEFRLKRYVKITRENEMIRIEGVEADDSPFYFIRRLSITAGDDYIKFKKEPFLIDSNRFTDNALLKFRFHSHYAEPPLTIQVTLNGNFVRLELEYNPFERIWGVNEYY